MDFKKIQEIVAHLRSETGADRRARDSKIDLRKGAFDVSNYRTDEQWKHAMSSPESVLVKKQANCSDLEKDFREFNDNCILLGVVLAKRGEPLENSIQRLSYYKRWMPQFGQNSDLKKAMDSVTSGSGLEWIPTNFSSQITEKVQLLANVARMFSRINMVSDPFKLPGINTFSVAKLGSENTAPTATTVGSRVTTLDAKKIIVDVPFSYELEEDAAFSLLPILREDISNAIARAIENATINGDTAVTHQDSDVTAVDDVRKAWNGLRKQTLSAAKEDLGTFNWEKLVGIGGVRDNMGIFGAEPGRLFWLTSPAGHAHLTTLKDSGGNPVVTRVLDFGQDMATVRTGSVEMLAGSEVLVSEFVREDLNVAGVHDGVTVDNTIIILCRKDAFIYGDRRSVLVEQDTNISAQTRNIVSSVRQAFDARLDAANLTVVAIGHNLSSV